MSGKLKISSNLFQGVFEYKNFQKFLDEWGYRRHILSNTKNYGIVKDLEIPELGEVLTKDAFYVSKFTNSPSGSVTVLKGLAIDSLGRYIVNPENRILEIPSDGIWYWIKVRHKYSNKESGKVSVDADGNLSGVGTSFLSTLRGQPNFPSKIRFLNSSGGNVNDYEVVSVISDTSAIIQGDFTNESNLDFAIVGTFTPGFAVASNDELIFEYDDCELVIVQESVLNTPPAHIINSEFMLARVRNNGTDIQVEDSRINWWQTYADWSNEFMNKNLNNPLIGVEGVQWKNKTSTKDSNLVLLSWGLRFSSYTINTSQKKVSVLIGEGGVFKDTSFFNTGDFNGWRLYSKNGSWKNIVDSEKAGSQIILTLDVLNKDDYGSSDLLFIAPPFEEIEIRFRRDGSIIDSNDQNNNGNTTEVFPWPNIEKIFSFNINTPISRIDVPALKGCYKYNVTYRYKTFKNYTDWKTLPSDSLGHFSESSYDDFGNKIDTGDLIGVNTTTLDNAFPVVNLEVGKDKKYQHFKGSTLTLNADMYINLNRKNSNNEFFRQGNEFFLHIEQWVILNGFKLRIVEDYINPTSFTLLADISENDLMYIRNNTSSDVSQSRRRGLFITCTFNEFNNWILFYDSENTPKGTVRMLGSLTPLNSFDSFGFGKAKGFWGWKIVNTMNNRFAMGTENPSEVGIIGGQNSFTISASNLPAHTHTFSGTTTADGSHAHNIYARDTGTAVAAYRDAEYGRGGDRQLCSPVSGKNTDDAPNHTHNFSGITSSYGSNAPIAIDKRPSYQTFLYIEKTV